MPEGISVPNWCIRDDDEERRRQLKKGKKPDQIFYNDLGNCAKKTRKIDVFLRRLEQGMLKVSYLNIEKIRFNTQDCKFLSRILTHNFRISTLRVSNCCLSDDNIREIIQNLPQWLAIRSLDFSNNEVGNRGAIFLAQSMGRLNLSRAPPRGFCKLRALSLAKNRVGDEGAKALGEVLTEHLCLPYFSTLNLRSNKIDDIGASWIAMAIRNNDNLRFVNLCANVMGLGGGIAELQLACEGKGAELNLEGVPLVKGGPLKVKVSFPSAAMERDRLARKSSLKTSATQGLFGMEGGGGRRGSNCSVEGKGGPEFSLSKTLHVFKPSHRLEAPKKNETLESIRKQMRPLEEVMRTSGRLLKLEKMRREEKEREEEDRRRREFRESRR